MLQKLTDILSDYFNIGDSYHYVLNRVKTAFGIGTMGLDNFEEYTEETVEEIAAYLIENGVTVQRWIPVEERKPKEGEKVLCINAKGNTFVAYPHPSINDAFFLPGFLGTCEGFRRATHWMPLPAAPGKDVSGDG